MACKPIYLVVLALVLSACESSPNTTTSSADETTGTSDATSEGTTAEPTGSSSSSSAAADETTMDLPGLHFKQDVWPILSARCSCHVVVPDGMTPGAVFDPVMGDDPAGAYLVLVNQPSTIAGLDYVEPGDSAASYLFHKVSGTQLDVGGNGTAMPPPPDSMISADQLTTIKEWIDTGALE